MAVASFLTYDNNAKKGRKKFYSTGPEASPVNTLAYYDAATIEQCVFDTNAGKQLS